uniref:PEP/pyruvate-binding domain-containing protein n=1 Tax=Mycolicibacterium poriferae TaxID=39694 RepID=UPI0024B8CDB6
MTDSVICRLDDVLATDRSRTGGKGANLAVMTRAGLPVPPGIVVTTSAYRRFVGDHSLDARITRELADVGEGPDAVAAASARLRKAFEAAPMSDELREEITAACALFGNAPVAVRSSATAEDLPEASFAGQQDSILGVVGSDAICDAVRRCWSSLWSARAIAYRRDKDIGHADISIAVVVQPMVAADVAGVLFTADPRSGRRDRIVVEAAPGLGEAVVGGGSNPGRWMIDTTTGSAISEPDRALLTAEQLDTLVDLGRRAADVFGTPQDVEWAVAEGRCWLVQAR